MLGFDGYSQVHFRDRRNNLRSGGLNLAECSVPLRQGTRFQSGEVELFNCVDDPRGLYGGDRSVGEADFSDY